MSLPRSPQPVKLIMSLLCREGEVLRQVLSAGDERFGPLDFLSESLPFDFTNYYEAEMGKNLNRRLVSFRPLIRPEELPEIKLLTNEREARFLNPKKGRRVNLDPGYLAPSKFILATGKDYSHRIYLGDGIFGDLTLMVRKGAFSPLPWTYPDYASSPLIDMLDLLRKRYLWQLKNEEGSKGSRV